MATYEEIHQRSLADPEGFWGEIGNALTWERRWDRVLDRSNAPFYRWFTGGVLNTCYNALDVHVKGGRAEQLALVYDSPVTNTVSTFTYRALLNQVARLAGTLQKRGIKKGDRVIIYMPMVPEAVIAMLACARIGAIHSVVFGGFAAHELAARIDHAKPSMMIAASCGIEAGKTIPYKPLLDKAIELSRFKPEQCIIFQRPQCDAPLIPGRDLDWGKAQQGVEPAPCTPVGTPDPGAFWRVASQHGVRALFTAPTAFRAIKRDDPLGEHIKKYDLSKFRALFLAGERCDPDTLLWAQDRLKVPVIDHWWQTETGWPIAANCTGLGPSKIKPGSASRAVPGYDVRILDEAGNEAAPNQTGSIAIKLPLPPACLLTLWNNDQGYRDTYLSRYPGYYLTGDAGFKDEEGYLSIMSRIDDIINVAGHRLSTGAMEEVLAAHPDVAECAVIGVKDELKGEIPVGFVVLKANVKRSEAEILKELVALVRDRIGPVAFFKVAAVVKRLPKTRSGKILRGTMRKIADSSEYKVPPTIDDPIILDEITDSLPHLGYAKQPRRLI